MAIATPVLAYLQIWPSARTCAIIHRQGTTGMFRTFVLFHIVVGIALALQILATTGLFWRKMPHVKPLVLTATLVAVLIGVQLALGAATWIVKYGWPAFMSNTDVAANFTVQANGWRQSQITTAHVANGSLILAISTILAMLSVANDQVAATNRGTKRRQHEHDTFRNGCMSTTTSTVVCTSRRSVLLARLADYAELSKPRIGAMVLVVVAVSAFVGSGGRPALRDSNPHADRHGAGGGQRQRIQSTYRTPQRCLDAAHRRSAVAGGAIASVRE